MYSLIPVFIPISFRFGWGWRSSTAQNAVKGPACGAREGRCNRYSTVTPLNLAMHGSSGGIPGSAHVVGNFGDINMSHTYILF